MDYIEEYAKNNKEAVKDLLAFFNNNSTQVARYFKTSVPTVSSWKARGRVSTHIAKIIDNDESLPFTKEFMRSDIKVW